MPTSKEKPNSNVFVYLQIARAIRKKRWHVLRSCIVFAFKNLDPDFDEDWFYKQSKEAENGNL